MGQSSTAILAYGYDLGGPGHWELEDDHFTFYDPTVHGYHGSSWVNAACREILVKFNHELPKHDWDYESVVKNVLGVEFVTYTTIDYPRFILAGKDLVHYAYDYGSKVIETDNEAYPNRLMRANAILYDALCALGIQPKQFSAKWILASLYG